jgi:hypothetical protein
MICCGCKDEQFLTVLLGPRMESEWCDFWWSFYARCLSFSFVRSRVPDGVAIHEWCIRVGEV